MEKKLTKKDNYKRILEIVKGNVELETFINHEIELLDKKNGKSGTKTKTQLENDNIKVEIVKALQEIDKAITITDLQNANETMAQYSNQKLSALLKQLVEDNAIEKIVDKKKSYFKAI